MEEHEPPIAISVVAAASNAPGALPRLFGLLYYSAGAYSEGVGACLAAMSQQIPPILPIP